MANQQAIIQDLHVLLPSYTQATFPAELTSTAASLYAQSRSRASNLKPEEEVARGFACCHLAAERLKSRLNLPAITAKPPCGPRVYKKLFQYLDKSLPQSTPLTTPRKSTRTFNADAGPSSLLGTPTRTPLTDKSLKRTPLSNITPSKRALDDEPATPTPRRGVDLLTESTKRRRVEDAGSTISPLKKSAAGSTWLQSACVHLVKKLPTLPFDSDVQVNRAASHIHVAVGEISRDKRYSDEELASLTVAVALLILIKINRISESEVRSKCMAGSQQMVALRRIGISRMGVVASDVGRWLSEEAETWRGMAWWDDVDEEDDLSAIDPALDSSLQTSVLTPTKRNDRVDPTPLKTQNSVAVVVPAVSRADAARQTNDDTLEEEEDEDDELGLDGEIEAVQVPKQVTAIQRVDATKGGLGTMFQDAVDWLSDERRAQYATWKESMLRRIAIKERGGKRSKAVR